MNKKEKKFRFSMSTVYALISLFGAIGFWALISSTKGGSVVLASPLQVLQAAGEMASTGKLWTNIKMSMSRSLTGFALAFICALPVAFLMGWYKPVRKIVEPWIKFLKSIPPISYITLIVVWQGIGEAAKVTVIFIGSFLIMVINIFQGVKNVDTTMIKAAQVLGANDFTIFYKVVVPASLPFILVGMRLGLASSLTTLIAAELTGAQNGLGQMIQEASMYFRMEVVLLGIITIGIIGSILDKLVTILERRLTAWQEVRNMD